MIKTNKWEQGQTMEGGIQMIVYISLTNSRPSQRQDNGIEHQSRHQDTTAMMRETQY